MCLKRAHYSVFKLSTVNVEAELRYEQHCGCSDKQESANRKQIYFQVGIKRVNNYTMYPRDTYIKKYVQHFYVHWQNYN
jgi:hypothetical protein